MEDCTIKTSTNENYLGKNIQIVGHFDEIAFNDGLSFTDIPYKEIILNKMMQMNEWAISYLSKPHEKLGRPGPVCPFVPQGIKKKSIFMAYYLCHKDTNMKDIQKAIQQYKDCFQQLENSKRLGSKYSALIIGFIHADAQVKPLNDIVESIQQLYKSSFIKQQLMIGQFFDGCQAGGIHNESFKPFNAPVPIIGIRKLMPQDIVFLTDTHEHMQSYIEQFAIKDKQSLMNLLKSVYLDKNKNILARVNVLLKHISV